MRNNKIFLFLATFCLLAGVFTSCQKDSVTLRLRMASFSHDGKVHMEGYTPKWDTGSDLVCVNGETCTVSNNAVSVSPSIDYKAVYPASICGSLENVNGVGVYYLTIPEYQVYKTVPGSDIQVVEAPMGAHSNTSAGSADLYFKNLGALLAITVDNQAGRGDLIVDKIIVTSDSKPLWGAATLAMPDVTTQSGDYNPSYVINETDNNHQSVILAGNANGGSMNVSIASGYPKQFYVYVPAFSTQPSNKFTFEVQVHNNDGEGVYRRAQTTAGSGNIPLNQIGSLTFALTSNYQTSWVDNTRPAGALRQGEFTINQNGDKVYFSAGNLQYYYGSEDHPWRIAANQWDYAGGTYGGTYYGTMAGIGDNSRDPEQQGATNKWIDLFGWGTSGYLGVSNQAMPWDYTSNKTYGGSAALDANYDWGRYNTIYDFNETGYVPDASNLQHWRTLNIAEWNYLLGSSRRSRSVGGGKGLGYTHSFVTVNGVPGLLIYPDGYSGSHPNNSGNFETINLNNYAGCAFLPCAGLRTQNNVGALPGLVTNPLGYYWTADYNSTTHAGFICFPTNLQDNFKFEYNTQDAHRYKGASVRLVYDVN